MIAYDEDALQALRLDEPQLPSREKAGIALSLLRRTRRRGTVRRPVAAGNAFRTVWISDLHLGSKRCKAEALLEFLASVHFETLYLVGDVIDEWKLRRSGVFPAAHRAVLAAVRAHEQAGARVVYVPGNHDASLRLHDGLDLDGIECRDEVVHRTLEGRRLLVTHGDRWDGCSDESALMVRVGAMAYEWMLALNDVYNGVGRRLGMRYRSVSLFLKQQVKEAVDFISRFEDALKSETLRRGLDGVVCGHIHKAELCELDGLIYGNDGDWVESCTALVEHPDGRLELMQWRDGGLVGIGAGGTYAAPDPERLMTAV